MNIVRDSLNRLYLYCKNQEYIGYDPYDALNSKVFQSAPFLKNHKIFRLVFLQANKKFKINLRPIFLIPKSRNPKGMGLFLSVVINLYKKEKNIEYLDLIEKFIHWLQEDMSSGYSGSCWGYNFDWQSRAFFLPKGTPTVVNTSFIGRAFVQAYELLKRPELLDIARSSCDFILRDLNQLKEDSAIGFSYTPLDHYFVNNATALASSLLGLVFSKTEERDLAEMAKKSAQFVIAHQQDNGSWNYGEDKTGRSVGIDNFHTGFILESLKIYSETTGDNDYHEKIKKGLNFYQNSFFLENGAPKYFYNRTFPLDIHSAAQAIITLVQLKKYGSDMALCKKIVAWMIENMQDQEGYFYYQKNRLYTNRIPYMRWSQAWALRALTEYLQV
jgi:rhamnogalacturonyl hydrolase YesR